VFQLPALIPGSYTVSLAAGALTDDEGQLLAAFSSQFTVDGPFTVSSVTPANGATLGVAPTELTVVLNDLVDPLTVAASDLVIGDGSLLVSGVAVQPDGATLVFQLPALVPGTYAVSLAAGAMADDEGQLLEAFSTQFTVLEPFTVSSVTPADGATLGAAPTELTVVLSDLVDPLTVAATDLVIGDGSLSASGVAVQPDGATLVFQLPALVPGTYAVSLAAGAVTDDEGQQLQAFSSSFTVDGPFTVSSVTPANEAILGAAPTQLTVVLNDLVDPLSVDVADLVIGDGSQLASGVAVQPDGATLVFQLPALVAGSYTVSLAAGALTDDEGQPLEAFSSGFEIDVTPPAITSSSLTAGSILSAGELAYTVTFSEPLNEGVLDASDIHLAGQLFGVQAASNFEYDADTFTLTVTYANLPEDAYALTLISGEVGPASLPSFTPCSCPLCRGLLETSAGGLQDIAGNPLAGGDFSVAFSVDATGSTPLELSRLEPLGSFINAVRGAPGLVNNTGDGDQFEFYVQAGQKLTALVAPSDPLATLTVEAVGMAGPIVAPGPGLPVLLPLTSITASGLATLRVKADRATTYELDVVVNALVESAVGDSSPGNSLALNDSVLDIGLGRLAVLGSSHPQQLPIGDLGAEPNDAIAQAVFSGVGWGHLSFTDSGQIGDNASLPSAPLDVDLVAVQLAAGDQIDIDVAASVGSSLDAVLRLFDASGQQVAVNDDVGASSDPHIEFLAPTGGAYYVGVSGFANLGYDPLVPGSGLGGSTGAYDLSIEVTPSASFNANLEPGETDIPDVDSYAVDWTGLPGKTVDIVLAGVDGTDFSGELLEILAADGTTVLATAAPNMGIPGGALVITNYVVGVGGIHFLRLTSSTPGDYSLTVMQGAAFESEPNDLLTEPLRQLLPGQVAVGFIGPQAPAGASAFSPGGAGGSLSLVSIPSTEPNNNIPLATPVPLGFNAGEDVAVDVTGSVSFSDVDYFKFTLNSGDVFGANISGGTLRLSLRDANGVELIGSSQDASSIYPDASPLPGGGSASLARVIDAPGEYFLRVSGSAANYDLNLRVFRPGLESQPVGSRQRLFLDFDGASVQRAAFGIGIGVATLSPLSEFLASWGLTALDENAVIDAIIAVVQESLSADIRALGGNGDFAASGMGGDFDIEILNSRDHADPFGEPHVSRVVVGGTVAEFGLSTIGRAQSIDIGNFETAESAVVLLDLLSGPASDSRSLNHYTLDPTASIVDLIGVGVGNIAAHEAAHLFGNFHTSRLNTTPRLTDEGGNLNIYVGLVGGVWGDGNEIDVDFGVDDYSVTEGFTGFENSMATIAYGLATALDPALVGPSVASISPTSGPQGSATISELVVSFNEPLLPLTAEDPLNFHLIVAGANGLLEDGGGDDVGIPLVPSYDGLQTVTLTVDESFTPLARGAYQLTISSNVQDVSGNALNSRNGPSSGSDHVHVFSVVPAGPNGDLFEIALQAGQRIVVTTQTPWDDLAGSPLSDLRPHLTLFNPAGAPVAADVGSFDGKNARLEFTSPDAGLYTLQIIGLSGGGEYVLDVELDVLAPERPADFDHDEDADGNDFLAWQRGFGMASGAEKSNGDADGDHDVDGSDLTIWTALFGTGAHSEGSLEMAVATAIAPAAGSVLNHADADQRAAALRPTRIDGAMSLGLSDAGAGSNADSIRSRLFGAATSSRVHSRFADATLGQFSARHELDRLLTAVDNALDSFSEVRHESWMTQVLDSDSVEDRSLDPLLVDESIVDYLLSSELADVLLHRRG
jgi:methionine-rich copper-binding protein CopC